MILILFLILGLIWGFVRKGRLANIGQADFKAWYLFAVSIILFLVLFGGLAFEAEFLKSETTCYFLMLAAYIVLLVGIMLNLRGVNIWMIFMLIGAMLNFAVIFLNYGKMPYSQEALNIAGISDLSSPIKMIASDSSSLNYLGGIIPIPIPFFEEVTSIGSLFVGIGIFGTVKNLLLGIVYVYDEDDFEDEEEDASEHVYQDESRNSAAAEAAAEAQPLNKKGIKRKKRSASENDEDDDSYYEGEDSDEFVFGKDYTLGNININTADIPPEPAEPLSDDEFLDMSTDFSEMPPADNNVYQEPPADNYSYQEPLPFTERTESRGSEDSAEQVYSNPLFEVPQYDETFSTKEFEPLKPDSDEEILYAQTILPDSEQDPENIVIEDSDAMNSESSYSEEIDKLSEEPEQEVFQAEDVYEQQYQDTATDETDFLFEDILSTPSFADSSTLDGFEDILSEDMVSFEEESFQETDFTYDEPAEEVSLDEIIETVITSPLPRDLSDGYSNRASAEQDDSDDDEYSEFNQEYDEGYDEFSENQQSELFEDPYAEINYGKPTQPDYFDDEPAPVQESAAPQTEAEEFDTSSPFIISNGRIVENPYYKFKRVSKTEPDSQSFRQQNNTAAGPRNPSLRNSKPSFNINQQQLKKNSTDQHKNISEIQKFEKVEMKSGSSPFKKPGDDENS